MSATAPPSVWEVCGTCGALVADPVRHAVWHETEQASRGERGQ